MSTETSMRRLPKIDTLWIYVSLAFIIVIGLWVWLVKTAPPPRYVDLEDYTHNEPIKSSQE